MAIKHKRRIARPIVGNDWDDSHEVDGALGALLPLASAPDSLPYIKDDLTGALTPITPFARAVLALLAAADLRALLGAVAKSGDAMSGALSLGNNKVTNLADPTGAQDAATKSYVDSIAGAVAGALTFKGGWDASTGTFPGTVGRKTGWFYKVDVAGTVDGVSFSVGDDVFAVVDTASTATYAGNWLKIEGRLTLAEIQAAVGFTFGTAAALNPGTSVGDLVQVIAGGKLPALDGSLLTNLPAASVAWAAITGKPAFGTAALKDYGTSPGQLVEVQTGGKLPALDASNLTGVPAGAGGWFQENYYSSSQTITIPAGATKCEVLMWAPTGGCGKLITYGRPGGGAALLKLLTGLTAGNTLVYTQGATAAAQASNGAGGNSGGNSTLASGTQAISTLTCNGGAGAAPSSNAGSATATGGDINAPGTGSMVADGSTISLNRSGVTGFHISIGPETDGAGGNPGGLRIRWYK